MKFFLIFAALTLSASVGAGKPSIAQLCHLLACQLGSMHGDILNLKFAEIPLHPAYIPNFEYTPLIEAVQALDKRSLVVDVEEGRFGEVYGKFISGYNAHARTGGELKMHHATQGSGVFTYAARLSGGHIDAGASVSDVLNDICLRVSCDVNIDRRKAIIMKFPPYDDEINPARPALSSDFDQIIDIVNSRNVASLVVEIDLSRFGEVYENFIRKYNAQTDQGRALKVHYSAQGSSVINFVAWLAPGQNKVPSFMTSLRGATAIINRRLRNGDIAVVLVQEYGQWKGLSGGVDLNELPLNAAIREAKEEIGLDIDERFLAPRFIGKYSKVKKTGVADEHSFFAFESVKPIQFHVEEEVKDAKWFVLGDILAIVPDKRGRRYIGEFYIADELVKMLVGYRKTGGYEISNADDNTYYITASLT